MIVRSKDSYAQLRSPDLCTSEYGHAEVNRSYVKGIEPSISLEFFRDAFGLCNSHHAESEFLEDTMGL